MSENHKKYRDNPELISNCLKEALASDDVAALAEETGLRRENLYRMFRGTRDPTVGNTMKVLAALGVRFLVEPRTSINPKPSRPKLGRPKSESKKH